MTDKKQPDALRLADALERPGYGWHSTPAQCAAELRRQYAEIETLRANLKTNEDLGDAGSDVQLLRMGYAAARLEIESLKAQQPGAAIQRYKIGYHSDEWGVRSSTPGGICDDAGPWVRYEDHVTALKAVQPVVTPQPGAAYAELPESLILAVDRWFADNTGLGGCSGKDVLELAELFYDVTHKGGRESVDDALAIVGSFGPGISGLNDTYARQILLAEEVKRLRASHGQAPAGATLPEGWVPLVIIHEGQYPEEIAYGPQRMMDRLDKWLRKYFDSVVAAATTQPAPKPSPAAQGDALDAACQRACMELPEGMSMAIQLERDAGWIELHGSYGDQIELPNADGSIAEQVHQAIDAARAAQEGK